MRKSLLFITFIYYFLSVSGQNIPKNPNQKDNQNRKQGKWTLLYNLLFRETDDEKNAVYYRISEFKDDKAVGITQYFFISNNQLHFEGEILEEENGEVKKLKGRNKWYFENGAIMREAEFDRNGNLISQKEYDKNGKDITAQYNKADINANKAVELFNQKKYSEALVIFEEALQFFNLLNYGESYYHLLTYAAISARDAKMYGKASKYYEQAMELALKGFGPYHENYAFIVESASANFLFANNITRYDYCIEELKKYYEKTKGKNSKEYIGVLNSAAFSYYYKQEFAKAIKSIKEILPLQEQLTGKNHKDYVTLVYDIACCYYELKDCSNAIPYLQESKNLMEKLNLKTSKDYQGVLDKLNQCK